MIAVAQNGIRRQRRKIAAVDILNHKYFNARATNRDAEDNLPPKLTEFIQRMNPFLKRALWAIIWFALFVMCTYQIVERITLFMDDPSSTKNYYQVNKTVIFPSILFCPDVDLKNTDSIHRLLHGQFPTKSNNDLDQMLESGNITVYDVWNATGRNIRKIETHLRQTENPRRKLFDVTKIYTLQGLCHNVVPLENLEFQGKEVTVELILHRDLYNLPELGIMSHSQKDLMLTKYLLLTGMRRQKTDSDLSYVLRPTLAMRRNSRSHPCADEEYVTKCLFDCLLNHIHSVSHSPLCRLPFMDEFHELPFCSMLDDIANTMQTLLNFVANFSRKQCFCPLVCYEIMYEMGDYNYLDSIDTTWRCLIQIAHNYILINREEINYRWFSLCCDLAGALGLWLGICLLQILETGTDYLSRILVIWRKKRSRQIMDNDSIRCSMRNKDPPKEELPAVDVVGVRIVLSRSSSTGVRISWSVMMIVSLCFSMYMCAVRISHYLGNPMATTLYYSPLENVEFPVITFCPEPPNGLLPAVDIYRLQDTLEKYVFFSDIPMLLESGEINITEIWKTSRVKLSTYAFSYMQHNGIVTEFNWTFSQTIVGKCISVTSDDKEAIRAIEGKSLFVSFHKDLLYASYLRYFRILLHTKEDYHSLIYLPKYDGYKFAAKNYDQFRIQFIEINHPKPCESKWKYSYCIVYCIEEAVFKAVSKACRLPYMQEDFTIPECYTIEEYLDVMNATFNILKTINFEHCKCRRPCQQYLYSFSSRVDGNVKVEEYGYITASFVIFAAKRQVLEEYAADNIISLISDLGGALSLLLGLCGLQVVKMILLLVTSSKTNCHEWTLSKSKRRDATAENLKKGVTSSGFKSKKTPAFWTRMLYFFMCIVVSVLCLSQCAERITYFWTDPSDVLTYHAYNDSILFPLITINPLAFSNDDAVNEAMKINPLFKILRIFVNDVPIDDISILKVRNMYGTGLSIKPSNPFRCVSEKCTMNIDVYISKDYGVSNLVSTMHSIEDFYYNPYDVSDKNALNSAVSLKIVDLTYRNTSQKPCVDGETATKCAINCLEKHLFANFTGTCRGPYVQGFTHVPECKDNEELYKMAEDIYWILLKGFHVENSAYRCSCPRKCRSLWYSYISDEKTNFRQYENITRFSLNFPDKLMFVIREEPAYTFFKLLSDIGGTVGLYFGFGIFQMLQILEDLFKYCKRLNFKQRCKKSLSYSNCRRIAADHNYYYR